MAARPLWGRVNTGGGGAAFSGLLKSVVLLIALSTVSAQLAPGPSFGFQGSCAQASSFGLTSQDLATLQSKLINSSVDSQVTYEYAADLIPNGLSNGTRPYYVLPTPSVVVKPGVPEDVVTAVQFAADHCLKIAARGTGHQIAGLALPQGGLTIDMINLNSATIDPSSRLAVVQMGARSGAVDAATLPYNLLPIAGTCNHVGVAGFTLQGGNGWASMWHGAAADFVQSLDVVTIGSNGTAVRKNITALSDPDLFFGFRGAGGNLGVAIAYQTVSFPTPTQVQANYYSVTIDQASEVLPWWFSFYAKAPVTIAPFVELSTAGSSTYGANILFVATNVGNATNETETFFKQMDAYLRPRSYSAPPNGTLYSTQPYTTFATDPEYCGNLSAATYWNTYYSANGTARTGNVSMDLIDTLVDAIIMANSSTATITFEASPTLPSGDDAKYFTPNAWSFRDSWQIFVGDTWNRQSGSDPYSEDADRIAWVRDTSRAIKPLTVGNYINQLMMEDADDSSRSYEAGIFARLNSVKAAADPNNLFRSLNYQHLVSSASSSSSSFSAAG